MRRGLITLIAVVCGFGAPSLLLAQVFQDAGVTWYGVPDGSEVDDCPGNCGAGCSSTFNPCGGSAQYWESQIVSGPTLVADNDQVLVCLGGSNHVAIATLDVYSGIARHTYYGSSSAACAEHDGLCGWETFPLCAVWTGCSQNHDDEWWYDTAVSGYQVVSLQYWGEYPGTCPFAPIY